MLLLWSLRPSVQPSGSRASNAGPGWTDRQSGGSGADIHIRSQGKSGFGREIDFNSTEADALDLADLLAGESNPTALEPDNGNPGIASGTDTTITIFDVAANR